MASLKGHNSFLGFTSKCLLMATPYISRTSSLPHECAKVLCISSVLQLIVALAGGGAGWRGSEFCLGTVTHCGQTSASLFPSHAWPGWQRHLGSGGTVLPRRSLCRMPACGSSVSVWIASSHLRKAGSLSQCNTVKIALNHHSPCS